MLKRFAPLCCLLIVAGIATAARAQDEDDGFWHRVKIGWHRNDEWPQPFIAADRSYAVSPFAVMIANGWQRQNLVGYNYFDEGAKRLNSAGIDRIRFILRQAPVEHRVIFVERDLNDDVTNRRVDAVQEAIATLLPKGPMPEVVVSNMVTEGRSAEIVTGEYKNYMNSPPPARLSGGYGGGSASGSSSAAPAAGGSGSGGTN